MIDGKDKARIEAAIRTFQEFQPAKSLNLKEVANLCRYFLTGEKNQDTWTNKDFGLEEEK